MVVVTYSRICYHGFFFKEKRESGKKLQDSKRGKVQNIPFQLHPLQKHPARKEEPIMHMNRIIAAIVAIAIAMCLTVGAFASQGGYGSGTVSSGGGSGSGGGGGASAYTPPSASNPVPATEAQVAAAAAASRPSPGGQAVIKLTNVSTIAASAIQSALQRVAAASGVTSAQIQIDAMDGRTIVSRVYIDQATAAALSGTVNFAVFTQGNDVNRANGTFKRYFDNNIASIALGQKGAYGASIRMAVKVDLSQLKADSLVFYAYDAATGRYARVTTTYSVDSKDYLHFSTPVGGTIVISDKPLARK
jgi:hypothetical protein